MLGLDNDGDPECGPVDTAEWRRGAVATKPYDCSLSRVARALISEDH